jgi:hypothetical protein
MRTWGEIYAVTKVCNLTQTLGRYHLMQKVCNLRSNHETKVCNLIKARMTQSHYCQLKGALNCTQDAVISLLLKQDMHETYRLPGTIFKLPGTGHLQMIVRARCCCRQAAEIYRYTAGTSHIKNFLQDVISSWSKVVHHQGRWGVRNMHLFKPIELYHQLQPHLFYLSCKTIWWYHRWYTSSSENCPRPSLLQRRPPVEIHWYTAGTRHH